MTQRQGTGTGQAVDELTPFDVLDINATGALERQRDAPRVAAGIGFLQFLPREQRRLIERVKCFRSVCG
ncbi:hypothetical protein D3C72_2528500 [compost metagenome]